MLTTPQQREVDVWLIKNQPQVQHLLENNNLKSLLYEVYEAGMKAQFDKELLNNQEEPDEDEDENHRVSYSSILVQNL